MRPRGVTLGQRGQFGAVRGGLGPQFRRAQGEPVLVQDLQPAAARGQQPARLGRGLGPQRFAEPAAGARHRRTAPPAPGGHDEMTIGVITAAEFQCHPPSQQMRLRRLAGAERPSSRAAARSAARSNWADTGPAAYRARTRTSPACACHQALC